MATVGFKNSNGTDLGDNLVPKQYLLDRYPELADTFRFAGLWLWGAGDFGSLGDNAITRKSSPVQTVSGGANWKQISCSNHSSAIKTDGTLWTWGGNGSGQLGDNTGGAGTGKSSPVQTVSGGTNWKQVSNGANHTAAIKTDGTLWTWGQNANGQLGDNGFANMLSPVQTISGGTNWKSVACGSTHTAAIKTNGTLWLWGQNASGQLGDNGITNMSSPVQTVAGGTSWKQISAGSQHTAAIKTDNTLWVWGYNFNGELGTNNVVYYSSPVQTTSGGTTWKQVSCGIDHTMAIKTDGTLWTWGSNVYGQLGDNTDVNKSSPIQTISGGTNWKQISIGSNFTTSAALKTDGTLWSWGENQYGTLGANDRTRRSSPIQTVSGGTNWTYISYGTNISAAIRDNSNDYI